MRNSNSMSLSFTTFFIIKNCKIYQNKKALKLNKHSIIKYFPYLVSSMGMSKDFGGVIDLTSESYVDSQNKERIKWYLEDLQRIKEGEESFFDSFSFELRIIKSIDEDSSLSSEKKAVVQAEESHPKKGASNV